MKDKRESDISNNYFFALLVVTLRLLGAGVGDELGTSTIIVPDELAKRGSIGPFLAMAAAVSLANFIRAKRGGGWLKLRGKGGGSHRGSFQTGSGNTKKSIFRKNQLIKFCHWPNS